MSIREGEIQRSGSAVAAPSDYDLRTRASCRTSCSVRLFRQPDRASCHKLLVPSHHTGDIRLRARLSRSFSAMHRFALGLLLSLSLAVTLSAADWSQFRGPTGD